MFTQSQYILLADPLSLDQIAPAFANFRVLGRTAGHSVAHWAHGTEFWTLAMPGDTRGRLMVDVVEHPWPDDYGPNVERAIFAAWSMGQFGPNVNPRCLQRAMAKNKGLSAAKDLANHKGFVRLRLAYEPENGAPPVPVERDALAELIFLTRVSYFCLELEGALAYFDPNGEVLASSRSVWESVDFYSALGVVPWHLWATVMPYADGWKSNGLDRMGWPEVHLVGEFESPIGHNVITAYLNDAGNHGKPRLGEWSHGGQIFRARSEPSATSGDTLILRKAVTDSPQ